MKDDPNTEIGKKYQAYRKNNPNATKDDLIKFLRHQEDDLRRQAGQSEDYISAMDKAKSKEGEIKATADISKEAEEKKKSAYKDEADARDQVNQNEENDAPDEVKQFGEDKLEYAKSQAHEAEDEAEEARRDKEDTLKDATSDLDAIKAKEKAEAEAKAEVKTKEKKNPASTDELEIELENNKPTDEPSNDAPTQPEVKKGSIQSVLQKITNLQNYNDFQGIVKELINEMKSSIVDYKVKNQSTQVNQSTQTNQSVPETQTPETPAQ
jgi:hypothetical protein